MEPLSPMLAVSGGLLVGAAVALHLLVNGRVAGISGMIVSALGMDVERLRRSQSRAFIGGLMLGGLAVAGLVPNNAVTVTSSAPQIVAAGLLVGFGARLANGCTSGHAICGVSRLSWRSIIATGLFLGAAAATVFLQRHVSG